MSSTTVVLNACQARNDSGSLTPSFTGLVTGRCGKKERRPLYTGVLVQMGGRGGAVPDVRAETEDRNGLVRGTSVVEGTEDRGSGNS